MIPLKVLFVEDDQVDQLAFQRFVEEHGLPITYLLAGSLSEAKCLVTQGKFDLIVADYSLGDGTALDLLPFAQGVPVILLTGVGDEEIAARAFTAGVSDYLVKDIGRNYLEQLPERMEKAVGQRLRSGEALPESEEKFRQLFTRMPSAVAIYDAVDDGEDFIFKDFNTAAEKVEGIKKDDLIGKRVTQVFPGVKDFGIFAVLQRVWRTGQPEFFPSAIYRDQRDPGTWRENWVYKLASGEIVAIYNDVTERKRAEEALREREERYRALFDRSFDLIFVHDFEGHFIDANDACLHLLGYEREDIPDLNFAMLLSEDQLSLALTILQEIRETGAQKNPAEFKLQHRNGSYVYVETKGSAILSKGAYVAIQSVARDITERKKTEEALKESEERYRRILDLSQEGIWVLDEQFRTTFVNSQISKWLGYPSEDIVGHPMEEFLFQGDIPDHQQEMREHKMKVDSQYEQRFQRKDGGAVWAIVSAKAISRDDKFQGSFAMLTDITERKKTEEALQESEEKYRLLIENQTDLVTKMDPKYRFLFVSPSYCKMFGKTEEEFFGKTFLPLVHEDDLEGTANALRGIAEPPYTSNYEQRAMTKDGWRWFAWSGTAVLDDNKNVTAIISVGRDITERKKMETVLQESEAQYRLLADNMKDQVWLMDLNLKPTYVSPSVEKSRGYTFEEIVQLPLDKQLTATSFQTAMEFFSIEMPKVLADPTYFAHSLELEFCCKDGSTLWFENMFSLIWDENGKPLSLLGVGREITERKQAEEKLALNFETQAAMNALLGLSLESRTIKEFLERSLDLVLSLQWLSVESKGAIFLADNAGKTLHLHVHKGLPKTLCAICSTVPFGYCICGRAAAVRTIQFADRVDERHDIHYEGMLPHGHYCVPVLSSDSILGVINLYVKEGHTRSPWEEDFLKAVANTLAGTLERRRAEESLVETHEKLRQSLDSTILVLASVAEMRDPYTAGHQQRVSELAQAIAQELGLPEAQVEGIRVAGLLHDLGKMQIPAEILSKPGKLTSVELMLIRTHSQSGYEILKSTVFPWPIAQFVLQHHERWDGSGYPAGLKGEEILLEARILAVADVVEAMSSHRPYRPAFEAHEALWEILQNKGTLYDVAVAEACQRVFEERQFHFRSQVG